MNTEIIINKSNGDLFDFYIKEKNLCFKAYISDEGWVDEVEVFSDVETSDIDIKIDESDNIYGVLNSSSGEIFHLKSIKPDGFDIKKLFIYDSEEYIIKHPIIQKIGQCLSIAYYVCNANNGSTWSLFSHYYDGNSWCENNIDFITVDKYITPFSLKRVEDELYIFYFNKNNSCEELFFSKFDTQEKKWDKPKRLTSTGNAKIYLNVLYSEQKYHMVWCEFEKEILFVKYLNLSIDYGKVKMNDIKTLSEGANCSMPCLIKMKDVIWCLWKQYNKVYSCLSKDGGNIWSEYVVDEDSINKNVLRFRFDSNLKQHTTKFKLDSGFGINNPNIAFIGFNVKKN